MKESQVISSDDGGESNKKFKKYAVPVEVSHELLRLNEIVSRKNHEIEELKNI